MFQKLFYVTFCYCRSCELQLVACDSEHSPQHVGNAEQGTRNHKSCTLPNIRLLHFQSGMHDVNCNNTLFLHVLHERNNYQSVSDWCGIVTRNNVSYVDIPQLGSSSAAKSPTASQSRLQTVELPSSLASCKAPVSLASKGSTTPLVRKGFFIRGVVVSAAALVAMVIRLAVANGTPIFTAYVIIMKHSSSAMHECNEHHMYITCT